MSGRCQRLFALSLCTFVMGTAVAAAIAAGPDKRQPMDPRGEPPGLKKGITECFKVWHNDDGWHVRVVNGRGSRDHRYQGTITVENGEIENLRSHLAKVNGVEKQWKHTAKKNQISFDFATSQNEDGINFRTSKGATIIRFSLKIDGDEVPQQIYVGKLGDHPDSATFVVPAHPTNRSIEQVTGNSKRPVK